MNNDEVMSVSPPTPVKLDPSPLYEVAVTIPITFIPSPLAVTAVPTVMRLVAVIIPVELILAKVEAVLVIILSVDATPVRPSPDPTNDVAVIIPAPASIPVELMVTADPTIALVDVVTPVTIAPSGNVGDALPVLPLKFVTLSVAIRDLRFEGHQ